MSDKSDVVKMLEDALQEPIITDYMLDIIEDAP